MSSIGTGSPTEQEVERLLCALEGIASARISADGYGRITAVHILAEAGFHPKQVVRNIESALSAGLGVTIDRRVVSVAQLQDGAEPPAGAATPAATANGNGAVSAVPEAPRGRLVFMSYDARTQPNSETLCRVTVRQHKEEFTGSATGSSTPLGRAQVAARALFSAITEGREQDNFVLDDVAIVSSLGRSFVLVAAHGRDGRELLPLTGVAQVTRGPEEAAILAGLQAVNRWNGLDD
ncbi:MAG TPA: hypothetical protein VFU06_06430 [Longimicrobiales bacterium]|nr:hypothetical protein [Longimicrobiales bacterium]